MKHTLAGATTVVTTLQEAGFIAFFAGGYVRDYLMGHPSDDIDIATNATVEQIQSLFPKTIPVGITFGIIIVVTGGRQFEVATFRKDRGYLDGRRPTGIDPATPQEDASRRDFTINGLFLDPVTHQIYDYVDGKRDIESRILRAIGNPDERFAEDRLRMMRAVRYSTRFGFPIEEKTLSAIRTHAQDLLPAVAVERIWQEFKKMAHFAHFDTGLILLHELGLLSVIFPNLKGVHIQEIEWRVRNIEKFPTHSPPFAQLLELFPNIDRGEIEDLAKYLKLSNKEKAFAAFYHRATALLGMPQTWLDRLEQIEWARLYADPFAKIGLEMLAAKQKDPKAFAQKHQVRRRALAAHIRRLQKRDPYLRAHHLIEVGIEPGEKMGQLLEEGMRIAVNRDISDSQKLIEILRDSSLW